MVADDEQSQRGEPRTLQIGVWLVVWVFLGASAIGGGAFTLGKFVFGLASEKNIEAEYVSKADLTSWSHCVEGEVDNALKELERRASIVRELLNAKHKSIGTMIVRVSDSEQAIEEALRTKNSARGAVAVFRQEFMVKEFWTIPQAIPAPAEMIAVSFERCKVSAN